MNFFIFQPEVLSSINFILGSQIWHFPSTLIFSFLFIILFILAWLFFRKKYSLLSIIIMVAAIAWLPLFAQFSYSAVKEFNDTWFVLPLPVREQITWRYCRIDKYQNLGGGFCSLYPFTEQVRSLIPKDSSITFLTSNLETYLSYYLYDDYRVLSLDEGPADYFVLYRPIDKFFYEKSLLYKIKAGTTEKKLLGKFTIVTAFASDQIIFKRSSH